MGRHTRAQTLVDRLFGLVPSQVRRAGSVTVTAVMLAICLVGVGILTVGLFIPQAMGALGYAVMTGSMSPTYPPGSLVVVQPAESYAVGDVITYQRYSLKPEVVTHRIVGLTHSSGGQTAYITQGDANSSADSEAVRPIQVRGKVRYAAPYLGHIATWLNTAQRTLFMYLVVGALGIYAIFHIVYAARVKEPLDISGSTDQYLLTDAATEQLRRGVASGQWLEG